MIDGLLIISVVPLLLFTCDFVFLLKTTYGKMDATYRSSRKPGREAIKHVLLCST